jgi:hypothetical protein
MPRADLASSRKPGVFKSGSFFFNVLSAFSKKNRQAAKKKIETWRLGVLGGKKS